MSDALNENEQLSEQVQYAGFWRRLAAAASDFFLCGLICCISAWVTDNILGFKDPIVAGCVCLTIILLYKPLFESSPWQAPPGKLALGIIVTDMQGRRISFMRALGRGLGMMLSKAIFYGGYIMIAFTQKKQGLHDILARCLVVCKS